MEVNHQQYHLTVKAPEHMEMDLPVEATVNLGVFSNEAAVREILGSHGFALTDLSGSRVRVKGSFLKLKAVKVSLEQLLNSQTKMAFTPKVSSGAISKRYAGNSSVSHGNRGGDKPPHASPSQPAAASSSSRVPGYSSQHPTSPEYRDQRGSSGPARESFVVHGDVFRYAAQLRKKEIEGILDNHNVRMEKCEVGESFNITLLGKSAKTAAGKLQSLMNDLNKSLRTQDVPLEDVDHEGRALLERIQKSRLVYNSVLVCQMNDKLHLIGPSGESYELKQRLGRPAGRRRRSSYLPPISCKNTAVGAAGYSPSKYQDDEQEAAEPERWGAACVGPGGALRGRSQSESREKTRAGRVNVQEVENKQPLPKSPKKTITQLLSFDTKDKMKKFKSFRK